MARVAAAAANKWRQVGVCVCKSWPKQLHSLQPHSLVAAFALCTPPLHRSLVVVRREENSRLAALESQLRNHDDYLLFPTGSLAWRQQVSVPV